MKTNFVRTLLVLGAVLVATTNRFLTVAQEGAMKSRVLLVLFLGLLLAATAVAQFDAQPDPFEVKVSGSADLGRRFAPAPSGRGVVAGDRIQAGLNQPRP